MKRDLKKYASAYLAQPFEPVIVHYRRQKLLELLPLLGGKSLLEIGCGMEPLFRFVTGLRHHTVLEPAQAFYDHARGLAAARPEVNVLKQPLESAQDLEGLNFDVIVMSGLLHELPDPKLALSKILSLCRRNTKIIINVPNANSFHRLLAVKMGLISVPFQLSKMNVQMQQKQVFSMLTLKQLVLEAGFRVLKSGTYFIKPFTHSQMQSMMDHHIINDQVMEGLMGMSDALPEMGAEIFMVLKPK